ncbi:MAG: type II toxin-antitoxin system VapB family antitoxin [Methylovulum sp.]|nr:type II toxin-antitoxin system VapB family antitoxin [Methylovulum sp.]
MKTTLDLPDELMTEAMQLTKFKTNAQVVILALQEFVKKNKVAGLKAYKDKVDFDVSIHLPL